jgi:hypothetical protein
MRERSGRCSLTRRTIADALGYEGRWAEESVRKLLNRAWELGEVLVFDGVGFRAPGARGAAAGVLVPVRLLQYLSQLPGVRRSAVLADPVILRALQARQEALLRELGPNAGPRPPPLLYGREGLAGPEFCPTQATGPGKASSPVSRSGEVSELRPELEATGGAAGGGGPSADCPDGAGDAGACSANGENAPFAPNAPPGELETPPAHVALPSPADGTAARGASPPANAGEARGAHDDEGRVDPRRVRAELDAIEALLAQLRDEANGFACGRTPDGVPLRARRRPAWAEEREGAAALAALRSRERDIARLERAAAKARFAARVGWKLSKTAEGEGMQLVDHRSERAQVGALLTAAAADLANAPVAWARLFPELRAALRPDQYGALRDLAELRCVNDAGDALVLRARDAFHADRVRDLGLARAIGIAAANILGRELAVEVLS